jgi:xylan 1,4-beta-xylosidase
VIAGLPPAAARALVRQYCVTGNYGNSYAAWQRMGSPQSVSPAQYAALERDAALASCGAPEWRTVKSGSLATRVALPRQGVSLIDVSWWL